MKRFKILFITDGYPTKERPVEHLYIQEHARAVALYDDVVVLHWLGEDRRAPGLWQLAEEKDRGLTQGIPTYTASYHPLVPKTGYLTLFWAASRILSVIAGRGFRPNIIHAQRYRVGKVAAFMSRQYDAPLVVSEHSTAIMTGKLSHRQVSEMGRTYQSAKVVLPVSRALEKSIQSYGCAPRLQVVPNAVDYRLFHPKEAQRVPRDTKRLLFVGHLVPNKGLPYLLDALAALRSLRENWYLDIVGDGFARATYQHLTIDLGLSGKVCFHGSLPKAEVAGLMRRAALFVLPSLYESFSVVAAEALMAGTPVLATRSGGPEEFITDDVGMLVAPGDAEALRAGLADMLDRLDSFPAQRLSEYARQLFSLEAVGCQIHAIYEKCLAEPGGP